MTPTEWNAALHRDVPWRTAYATLAEEARSALASQETPIATTELVNRLYPPQYADNDEAMRVRKRMFKGVMAMAPAELSDCASRGVERKTVMGKPARPWIWHKSTGPRPAPGEALAALAARLLATASAVLDGADDDADWKRLEQAADALRAYIETEKPAGAAQAFLAAMTAEG